MYASTHSTLANGYVAANSAPRPRARWALLEIWLPLVLVGVAMFIVEHDFYYATPRFQVELGGVDVVSDAAGSDTARAVCILALGAMGGLFLLTRSATSNALDKRILWIIAALCTYLVSSAIWSDDPELTLKRSAQPMLLIIAALGFAKHWRPVDFCHFTVVLTGGVLLLGIAAAIAGGSFLVGEPYRFSGTLHPNFQSVNCAALSLASLALFLGVDRAGRRRYSWGWLAPFAVGLTFLYLTRSRTTTAALLVSIAAFAFLIAPRRGKAVIGFVMLFVVGLLGVLLVCGDSDTRGMFVDALEMGRDDSAAKMSSLTGRIPIWNQVLWDASEAPLLGYGYGAFWTSQRVLQYSHILNWEFSHAHSAYLETLLNVGAIGLVIGLTLVVFSAVGALREFRATGDAGYLFIFSLLLFALMQGALDSNFVVVGTAPMLAAIGIALVAVRRPRMEPAADPVVA